MLRAFGAFLSVFYLLSLIVRLTDWPSCLD
jgi:hypothetical protein